MSEPQAVEPTARRLTPASSNGLRDALLWWVLPCVVLCVGHLLLAELVSVPQKGDELVYLGNARYLATGEGLVDATGRDPYKIGYSLLLVPAFWVDASALGGFALAQWINALLLTAMYPGLWLLAKCLAPQRTRSERAWVAFALACYPAVWLYGTTAMSENAFLPTFVFLLVFAHRALTGRRALDYGTWAALTVFLYFVHERAAGILLTALGVAACAAWQDLRKPGQRRWEWLAFPGVATAAYVLLQAIEVSGSRWQTGSRSEGFVRQALAVPESLIATLTGHLWSLSLATVGILAWGVSLRLLEGWRQSEKPASRSSRAPLLFWWLLTLGSGSVLAVSVVFLAQRPEAQFTHWAYGRYWEGVVLPVLLVAILALYPSLEGSGERSESGWLSRSSRWKALGLTWTLTMLGVGGLALLLDGLWSEAMGMPYSFSVSSLPVFSLPLGWGILRLSASFAGGAVLVALAFLWRWRLGVGVLGGFFLLSTTATLQDSWIERAAATAQQHQLAVLVRRLDVPRKVVMVEPNQGKVHHFHYYNLTYFLPDFEFVTLGEKVRRAPPGELVLSADLNFPSRFPGARLLGVEAMPKISPGYTQSLWVLPGALSRRLEADGYWQ